MLHDHSTWIPDEGVACQSSSFPIKHFHHAMTKGITRDLLAHPVRGIRCGGSAGVDMMHVARGRLDAYFEALPRWEDVKWMGGTGICNGWSITLQWHIRTGSLQRQSLSIFSRGCITWDLLQNRYISRYILKVAGWGAPHNPFRSCFQLFHSPSPAV